MERADSGGDQETFENGKWLRFAEESLSPPEDIPNCGERADKLRSCRMENTTPALFRKAQLPVFPIRKTITYIVSRSNDPRVHFIILGSLQYFLAYIWPEDFPPLIISRIDQTQHQVHSQSKYHKQSKIIDIRRAAAGDSLVVISAAVAKSLFIANPCKADYKAS